MFETINNWIVTYMETPHYQRTIECDCLFWLAIMIYLALAAAAIFIIWLVAMRFKKFVDKVAEKEARYKEEEKMIYEAHDLELNNAIECIRDFCKAKKGRCIGCPAYITFRIESGDTVQTCKFRCDAPANWERIDGCEREEDSLEKQEPTKEAKTEGEE